MPKKSFLSGFWSKPKPVEPEVVRRSATQTQTYAGMTWIDIEDPTNQTIAKAADDYKLHELHVEQCLQTSQVTQMNVEQHYIFLLFYFPYVIKEENRIATSQVSIFLGRNFLLTLHDSTQRQIVDQLFREYQADDVKGPKTPGRMLYQLINYLLKDTAQLIEKVMVELDDLECSVYNGRSSDAQRISQLRRSIASLSRTIDMQKGVLNDLDEIIDTFTKDHLSRYFTHNTKFSQKLSQTIAEANETIEIYKDADFIASTERTNDILAILTLLFTLTIPATVIGTFYGMNVLLPGSLQSTQWTFLGAYSTFKALILLSIGAAAIMLWYFKKKRWF